MRRRDDLPVSKTSLKMSIEFSSGNPYEGSISSKRNKDYHSTINRGELDVSSDFNTSML
jgi:hypothetical protein